MAAVLRGGQLLLVVSLAVPFAAVVSSCATVIGLNDIDRVACVADCGAPDASSADVTRAGGHDASHDAKNPQKLPDARIHRDSATSRDTGPPPCAQDSQCTSPANPRCDIATGACVPCLPTNDNCPKGTFCNATGMSYTCATGCSTAADCAGVDAGGLGTVGDAGRDAGAPAIACCNAACVDISADPSNCGGCGMACSSSNVATVTCGAGVCNGTCAAGYADCDGNKLTNGCETQIDGTDTMNCGGCGTTCSSANITTVTCATGVCNGACNAGYADCNMDKQKDGCETDLNTDPSNCSACGTACSGNHVPTPTCAAGKCTGACAAGYSACGGNLQASGCSVALDTDPNNCGACGTVCSGNHMATVTCGAGVCDGACAANYSDCDANKQMDGCEDETPAPCTAGTDVSGSPWTVCTSSCASAWLSSTRTGAGNLYNLLTICNSLGYSRVNPTYAGNCGDTCGTCTAGTSCTTPGTPSFTGLSYTNGTSVGSTVEWECLR